MNVGVVRNEESAKVVMMKDETVALCCDEMGKELDWVFRQM
jgi:hypothetical protein